MPHELYFLCIIFLDWVFCLVKQISYLLTPGQLVIHSDLWTFIITLILSKKSSCSPSVLALCLFSEAFMYSFIKLCKVLSYIYLI